ncbi:efflux RND transporter permease subunit [Lacimicrobium alkaliphilum]|uniref:Cation efflux system protein n=1 Tax=Lacimicrobium alkaliphilum TaxID=1526571 RepID=A0ABQ1RC90_9ALTE|nr:efflux RND transporter permease subunit [Lacimicrobium alkaliphilum]GGD63728.1 cation efflux system protein [Lacimicrobium alkaliphilum]
MLHQLLRFSLTQRVFVVVMLGVLFALGIRAWFGLPIDAFPDISPTQVKVILKVPGMTAEEIESQVTRPLEAELLGIPKQAILRSSTKYAITSITLDFQEGTDIYWARQQVNKRLSGIRGDFPAGTAGGVAPMSTPLSEMFMFSLENPSLSLTERRHLLDWEIRPLLRTVPGVAEVNSLGGYVQTLQFSPDNSLMAVAGIGMEQVQQAIQSSNINGSVGRMNVGTESLIIRTQGRFATQQDLAGLIVKADDNGIVRLSDLGDISTGHLARYGAVTKDGQETAQALIIALKNSNTADVVKGVKEKLAQIAPTLPEGTDLNVFYDRKTLIDTAVGTITNALVEAVILVIIILALFLGNLRAAFLVSLSIPFAALLTFLMMSYTNLSANLMSLGGVVIAIGMIVDSSVVVVENIVSQLNRKLPLPRLHLIYRASKAVATPVLAGTAIVIIVFVPLLTLTGLEGKLFSPVALTIVFAMLSALLISLTIVPVIASFLIKGENLAPPKFIRSLQRIYQASLIKLLARPGPFVGGAIVAVIISLFLFTQLGKTFMPVLDEGDIIVQLEKSPTISLADSVELDRQVSEALLKQVPEIKQIVARTGADELGLDPMGLNETDMFMELQPTEQWRFDTKDELAGAIREVLQTFPGINFGFTQPIQMRVSEMLTGSTGDVSIKVFGDDIAALATLTDSIAGITGNTSGAVDVNASIIEGAEFLNVHLKPELATEYGLSVDALAQGLRAQVEGVQVSELIQGKVKTPIIIGYQGNTAQQPASTNELENAMLTLPDGRVARVGDVASLSYAQGPSIISRENGNRFAVVTTNVTGRDIVGFVEELRENIHQQISLPTGYTIEYGGEFENQIRASNSLMMVIPAVILLIVIILFSTFQSLPHSMLILLNVPFALMGGIVGLFISGQYLSVPASVGFIALLGIAVLNGVVMLSHFQQLRARSRDLKELVCDGAADRLRPILMTATTAMFGLFPLALATGPGAEIQKPLAIVVIGGLLTSTITTLYLLPMLYYKLENKHGK